LLFEWKILQKQIGYYIGFQFIIEIVLAIRAISIIILKQYLIFHCYRERKL